MLRTLVLLLFGLAAIAAPASAVPRAAVLNGNDNTLSLVDVTTGQSTLNAATFPGFPGHAVVRGGKLYVAVSGADLLLVLDAYTLAPLDTLRTGVGTNPYAVAVSGAGDVYASLFLTNQIVKFNADGVEVGRVSVGRAPEGLLLVDDRLFVADSGIRLSDFGYDPGTLTVLDTASLANRGTVPVGLNPQWMHETDGEIHVVCTGNYYSVFGEVHVVSLTDLAPVDTVMLGGSPGYLEFADGVGYTSEYFGGIASYRLSTREVLHSFADPIAFGGAGYSGMLTDDAGSLYVALYGDDVLVRLRLTDCTPEVAYATGDGPSWVVLLPEAPVSVRLLAFATESTARGVNVRWTVAHEADAVRFSLARALGGAESTDGTVQTCAPTEMDAVWTDVADVAASDLVLGPDGQTARVIDAAAPAGRLVYRLSATLRDGSVEVLGVRETQHALAANPPLVVRPVMNPARGPLALTVSAAGAEIVHVSLIDAAGRVAAATRIAPGVTSAAWNLSGVAPGIYFLRATQGTRAAVSRVVLLP
jgi:hypothetical protein